MIHIDFETREITPTIIYKGSEFYKELKNLWAINDEFRQYEFPIQGITPNIYTLNDYTLTQEGILNLRDVGISEYTNGTQTKIYASFKSLLEPCIDINTSELINQQKYWHGELLEITHSVFQLILNETTFMTDLGLGDIQGQVYSFPGEFLDKDVVTNAEKYKLSNPEWFI